MLGRVFRGWDFWCAIAAAVLVLTAGPSHLAHVVAAEIYGAGISVLSIIFAVYFTALAVIIAAGDDDFVEYLREKDVYEVLIGVFRFTLWTLFLSLFASVALFVYSVIRGSQRTGSLQSIWLMTIFAFVASYALFATMSSTRHALNYARFRVLFLAKRKQEVTPRQPSPPGPPS